MKKLLLSFLFISVFYTAFSQQAARAVFAELGGPGVASFNYDQRFSKREDGIGGRVGVGGFSISDVGVVFVPVGLNYLMGKDSKNYFELGAGVTPVFISGDISDDDENEKFRTTFGHLNIGYRLQPATGCFFFRAAINPIFGKGFFFPYYGGIAFGYKF